MACTLLASLWCVMAPTIVDRRLPLVVVLVPVFAAVAPPLTVPPVGVGWPSWDNS